MPYFFTKKRESCYFTLFTYSLLSLETFPQKYCDNHYNIYTVLFFHLKKPFAPTLLEETCHSCTKNWEKLFTTPLSFYYCTMLPPCLVNIIVSFSHEPPLKFSYHFLRSWSCSLTSRRLFLLEIRFFFVVASLNLVILLLTYISLCNLIAAL